MFSLASGFAAGTRRIAAIHAAGIRDLGCQNLQTVRDQT
jgi:hypothetical protein